VPFLRDVISKYLLLLCLASGHGVCVHSTIGKEVQEKQEEPGGCTKLQHPLAEFGLCSSEVCLFRDPSWHAVLYLSKGTHVLLPDDLFSSPLSPLSHRKALSTPQPHLKTDLTPILTAHTASD
jgi:hypothetical protein